MNTRRRRRFVFIDYETLTTVKVKKLLRVATKMFVFVDTNRYPVIPVDFVRKVQPFGKDIKWIPLSNEDEEQNLNFHMAFIMGRLHQKAGFDVEFIVITDDTDFDSLVGFINASGRRCRRVTRYPDSAPYADAPHEYDTTDHFSTSAFSDHDFLHSSAVQELKEVLVEDEIITRTAEETVKRLILSGERPKEISALRDYILLHNQEVSLHNSVDRIIQQMKKSNDIDIQKGQVIYNF